MTNEQNITPKPDVDVVIVGAGLAGLAAAEDLQKQGLTVKIIEAGSVPGGRVQNGTWSARTLPDGTKVPEQKFDKGAHWAHPRSAAAEGGKSDLEEMFIAHGITSGWNRDIIGQRSTYVSSGAVSPSATVQKTLDAGIDWNTLRQYAAIEHTPEGVRELGRPKSLYDFIRQYLPSDEKIKVENALGYLDQVWYGGNGAGKDISPFVISGGGKAFPGGVQLKGGMGQLPEAMAKKIGEENFLFNTPVNAITSKENGLVEVATGGGEAITSSRVVYTGSIGTIQRGLVTFDPPLDKKMQKIIEDIQMANMAKIVLRLDPKFANGLNITENTHIDLPQAGTDEFRPGVFCHIAKDKSNPKDVPVVTLFIGGKENAERVEKMSPEEAKKFAVAALSQVPNFKGFKKENIIDFFVTNWTQDQYIGGAYSLVRPGTKRHGPRPDENDSKRFVAGESFVSVEQGTAATQAGAIWSGKDVAQQVAQSIQQERGLATVAAPKFAVQDATGASLTGAQAAHPEGGPATSFSPLTQQRMR